MVLGLLLGFTEDDRLVKATKLSYFRRNHLRLARYLNSRCRFAVRDKFILWECTVQPFYFTSDYRLCLNYEIGWPPRVWIVKPDLY